VINHTSRLVRVGLPSALEDVSGGLVRSVVVKLVTFVSGGREALGRVDDDETTVRDLGPVVGDRSLLEVIADWDRLGPRIAHAERQVPREGRSDRRSGGLDAPAGQISETTRQHAGARP
jgi:hypothetical protein